MECRAHIVQRPGDSSRLDIFIPEGIVPAAPTDEALRVLGMRGGEFDPELFSDEWERLYLLNLALIVPVTNGVGGSVYGSALVEFYQPSGRLCATGSIIRADGKITLFHQGTAEPYTRERKRNGSNGISFRNAELGPAPESPDYLDSADWYGTRISTRIDSSWVVASALVRNSYQSQMKLDLLSGDPTRIAVHEAQLGFSFQAMIDVMDRFQAVGNQVRAGFYEKLEPEALELASAGADTFSPVLYNAMFPQELADQAHRKALYIRQALRRYPLLATLLLENHQRQRLPEVLDEIQHGESCRDVITRHLLREYDEIHQRSFVRTLDLLKESDLPPRWLNGRMLAPLVHGASFSSFVPKDTDRAKLIAGAAIQLSAQDGVFRQRLSAELRRPSGTIPDEPTIRHIHEFERWLAGRIAPLKGTPVHTQIVDALRGKGIAWWQEKSKLWGETLSRRTEPSLDSPVWRSLTRESVTVGDWTFHEIRDAGGLREEGEAMSHCVSSYSAGCARNESRIFSIQDQTRCRIATLEVGTAQHPFTMKQVRGPRNEAVPHSITVSAAAFVEALEQRTTPWVDRYVVATLGRPYSKDQVTRLIPPLQACQILQEDLDLMPMSRTRLGDELRQLEASLLAAEPGAETPAPEFQVA